MKTKNALKHLFQFRWQPTKDTAIAFILGFIVIAISLALLPFSESGNATVERIGFLVLRDIVMVFCLGFAFPLYYILIAKKGSLSEFGVTRRKWLISLVVGIVLAILLFFQFMSEAENVGQSVLLNPKAIGPIFYIMIAGIFEVIFFYAFLRQRFENAFGIIPSVLLTALFYSFHHAGFQPEFMKLFFVGIMYASVFRITKNILIIYPFFWGVGACWDVLVSFGAMKEFIEVGIWIHGLITLILMIIFVGYLKWRMRKA